MKSNKGQAMLAVGVIGVLLLGVIAFGIFSQTQLGEDVENKPQSCPDSTTTMTFSAVDKLNQGSSVTTTVNARINDAPSKVVTSSTTFTVGDEVEIMHNATNFLDNKLDKFTVNCGQSQAPTAELYATSTNSFRIFNSDGNLLTDNSAGGATNQSSSASPINLDIRIDSTSDESSGDLVVVVEGENTTEIDDIQLSGLGGAERGTTPEFYSPVAAGSIVKAFEVPQVIDGASVSGTLTLSPESGQTIGAADTSVYVTAYSKQWFVDTDGTFQLGVENADGATKYEDTWDYDFVVT